MTLLANSSISHDAYQAEEDGIRERFARSHDGQAAVRERSNLIDSVIRELWNQFSPAVAGEDLRSCDGRLRPQRAISLL